MFLSPMLTTNTRILEVYFTAKFHKRIWFSARIFLFMGIWWNHSQLSRYAYAFTLGVVSCTKYVDQATQITRLKNRKRVTFRCPTFGQSRCRIAFIMLQTRPMPSRIYASCRHMLQECRIFALRYNSVPWYRVEKLGQSETTPETPVPLDVAFSINTANYTTPRYTICLVWHQQLREVTHEPFFGEFSWSQLYSDSVNQERIVKGLVSNIVSAIRVWPVLPL